MPLTILVADDEPGIRLSVRDYLQTSGYSVLMAATGKAALEMIATYQPHLMVTDITMPEMDGFDLVTQVRQQPAFRLLPVIFLTSRTATQDRIRGYQAGVDVYLPKPFELDELGAIIRNLLDRMQIVQTERLRPQIQSPEISDQHVAIASQKLGLTQREQSVLAHLLEGLSNAQIGELLHLSARTIEKYVSSLLQKTGAHNRAELVRFAIEHHLLKSS
jgi:DNA-binding NarL/FixJ family response regulator